MGQPAKTSRPVSSVTLVFYRPVIGSTLDAAVSLDLLNSVSVQTNAQTGLPEVTIGKCSGNTDKISISLLGR